MCNGQHVNYCRIEKKVLGYRLSQEEELPAMYAQTTNIESPKLESKAYMHACNPQIKLNPRPK